MRVVKVWLWIVIGLQSALGQNLVPDSSFEMNHEMPMDFSQVGASNYWSLPSQGTSDLFCKCDRKTKIFRERIYSQVDVPQNPMGDQMPHSGTCYAGFFVFSHGDYREYLQSPLTSPLEKNKTYLFSVYLSLADYSVTSIDQLGVCFLNEKMAYSSSDVITNLSPSYMNIERAIRNDVKHWHQVTVQYKARGGERYVLLGSFEVNKIRKMRLQAPKDLKTRINQRGGRDAYYFVDDVSVVEIEVPEPIDTASTPQGPPLKDLPADSIMTLKNVLFRSNEARLLTASFSELDTLVDYLKKYPHTTISISGHTDNTGNEHHNEKLSRGRAKAVADYLIRQGIDETRVRYQGYGSSRPLSDNATEAGKQLNRRVEFRLSTF